MQPDEGGHLQLGSLGPMSDVSCPSGKRPLLDTNQLDNWGCIILENVCMDQVRLALPWCLWLHCQGNSSVHWRAETDVLVKPAWVFSVRLHVFAELGRFTFGLLDCIFSLRAVCCH